MSPPLPPPARKEFERAVSLFRQGRLATAEEVCAGLIARHPQDSEVAYFAGVLANRMGRFEAAVQRLTRCVQAEPQRARAQAALGLAHEQLGQLEQAIASFAAAVRAEPSFADARNGLGVALFRAGRLDEAVASFDAAIALDPKGVEARMNRARALRKLGRDAQAAKAWWEALHLAGGREDVQRMCAMGLVESGDRAAGIQALRAYLERAPQDALARSQLALALEAAQPEEALVEIERAQAASSAPEILMARGTVMMRLGRYEESLAAFDAAEAARPSPETRVNQALVLKAMGRRHEALAKMGEAEEGLDARGLTQLAAMYIAMEEPDKAMELLARALAEAPALAEAHATRAFEYLRRGDLDDGWREYLYRPTRGLSILERITTGAYPPPLPASLAGAHVAIRAEQGLGDVLFFLRYAAPLAAAGARLTLVGIEGRLRGIVERALPVSHSDSEVPAGAVEIWAGDLPLFVRPLTRRGIEPSLALVALPERVAAMRRRLGDEQLVGVAWRAGTTPRSGPIGQKVLSKQVEARTLGQALARWPGRVVVVQRNPSADEARQFALGLGREPLDLSAANEDLEDTLALMSILDEYVGVSSTNVHLRLGAGLGGRVLVPDPADWRWRASGDSPWFPGYKTYREEVGGGWDRALDELRRDLEREAK